MEDRELTRKELLSSIRSKFGAESVYLYSENRAALDVEVRSSGSLMLDLALGGGYPKGRVVEFSGREKSGKCLTSDSMLLTKYGYMPLKKIFAEMGYLAYDSSKIVKASFPLINRYGQVEYTSHLTFNSVQPLLSITTVNGLNLKVTYNHPLLVNRQQKELWVTAKNLKEGDILVSRIGDRKGGTRSAYSLKLDWGLLGGAIRRSAFGEDLERGLVEDVLLEPLKNQLDFLKGFFSRRKGTRFNVKGRKKTISKVQLLLYNLGVPSTVSKNTITVPKQSRDSFLGVLNGETVASKPYYEYETIKEIKEIPEEPTFDVVMPATHSFIANGIINHNTTLFNLAVAEAQISEPDKENIIIDLENSYNPTWASKLGVDANKILISQPDTYAEKVYDYLEYLLTTGKFAYICIDSISGLIGKDEFEETDWNRESRVGGVSKLNAKAMRKFVNSGLLRKSGTTLVFINQLRDKIGGFSLYGTPTTTGGGRSLKHAYSQQLEISPGEQFVKGSGANREVLGQQVKVRVSKNKIAAPYRTASIDLFFETGVDRVSELVKVAKEIGVLQGTSWLRLVDPSTGEVLTDKEGKEYKWHGINKTVEAISSDAVNQGVLYGKIFDLVNSVLRGVGE